MCVKLPPNKSRVRQCNFSSFKNFSTKAAISDFCMPNKNTNDTWIGPEYDTENQSHMVFYANEGSSSDEVYKHY